MKPYYEHAGITIYHGDCREVMFEELDDAVGMVITDPPYVGLSEKPLQFLVGGVCLELDNLTHSVGNPWDANLDWISQAWKYAINGMMIFCSYHSIAEVRLAVPGKAIALLTWYKRNSPPAVCNVPRFTTEFIWCFQKDPGLLWRKLDSTLLDIPMISAGCVSTGERFTEDNGKATHPCQKPLDLMVSLMRIEPTSVLDPFMGTGTTLLAAKSLNIPAIGIEIEERYCEIAARRLSQEVLDFGNGRTEEVREVRNEVQGEIRIPE
jgi:site-specific DNA-methyltransferase (adenine-specific)